MQVMVAQKVAVGVYKGVTTSELDELAAETSASMTATHPDYALVQLTSHLCAAWFDTFAPLVFPCTIAYGLSSRLWLSEHLTFSLRVSLQADTTFATSKCPCLSCSLQPELLFPIFTKTH